MLLATRERCLLDTEWLHLQVPVLVARYAGDNELAEKVSAAVQVHQDNQEAVEAALVFSAILERMALLGFSLEVKLSTLHCQPLRHCNSKLLCSVLSSVNLTAHRYV